MILECEDFINDKHQSIINFALSQNIPLLWHYDQVKGDNRPFLAHVLVSRDTNKIVSPYALDFIEMFNSCLIKLKLNFNVILRASVNVMFPIDDKKNPPILHLDHEFKHKQFIMYFNDCDGDTEIILDDGNKLLITPKKNKAILFGCLKHRVFSPSTGRRTSLVVTYD
jgi:hypothetical protein